MTLYELNQRLKYFNLNAEVLRIIKLKNKELADLNRDQLLAGKNSMNNRIRPRYKSKAYAKKKNFRNNRPGLGTPDIFYEGDFHKGIYVKANLKSYEFLSLDGKTPELTAKYPLLLGLSVKNTEKASKNIIFPELKNRLNKTLKK